MNTPTTIETVSTGADKAKLALAVLLLAGGVAAFYLLGKQDLWVRVLAIPRPALYAGILVFATLGAYSLHQSVVVRGRRGAGRPRGRHHSRRTSIQASSSARISSFGTRPSEAPERR